MQREAITQLMRELEQKYDVLDWTCFGWNAWPLLRTSMSFWLFNPKRPGITRVLSRCAAIPLVTEARVLFGDMRSKEQPPMFPDSFRAPVLILDTHSIQRRRPNGYLYYYGPLLDDLDDRNIDVGIIRTGSFRGNEDLLPCPVIQWADRTSSLRPGRLKWKRDYRKMLSEVSQRTGIGVAEIDWTWLGAIEMEARRFQRTFESVNARTLLITCWYRHTSFAATLAASRSSMRSIDVQHGSHDEGHFSYSGWVAGSPDGYQLVPDLFWCWSEEAVRVFQEQNPGLNGSTQAFVGGNPWVNANVVKVMSPDQTLYDRAKVIADGSNRNIAVCMTGHMMEQIDDLLHLFRQAPSEWRWWFRVHRQAKDQVETIQGLLNAHGCENVDLDYSNSVSLFELFHICDTVISDWSTCAQEALAFGKPVLLIHRNGRHSYSDAIADGCMIYCEDPESWVQALRGITDIPTKQIRDFSRHYFAPSDSFDPHQWI